MKFELNYLPTNATDEDVFAEIRRIDSLLGKKFLTRDDFDKNSKIHSGTLVRRFNNWQTVLTKAGIEHKYSGRPISKKMLHQGGRSLTNEEIVTELKRIAKLLKKDFITQEDINDNSEIISGGILRKRFGSFRKGMKIAGLKASEMYRRKYSNEEYFENFLSVWTHYGRQPLRRELNEPPSEISAGAYENRFGSFRKALELFVERMNQDEEGGKQIFKTEILEAPVQEKIKKHSVAAEDRHSIRLGLRYKVLNRDKFKCIRCGTSPATDQTCKLHIDHIIPFSKGGKTILENLQTLCEKCNLGKGNRHFE